MKNSESASKGEILGLYFHHKAFFNHAFLISFLINVLAFAVPIHMLQVYDRVLTSGHVETLLVITGAVFFALLLQAMLDALRSRLLLSLAAEFEAKMRDQIFALSVIRSSKRKLNQLPPLWQMCQSVKTFISGPWMGAFLDLPWVPLYLVVIYQFHPLLGVSSIVAASLMVLIALGNHKATQGSTAKATQLSVAVREHLESSIRNADAIRGLGMLPHATRLWTERLNKANEAAGMAQAVSTNATSLSKFFRLFLQVWTLSLGAYLVVNQEMSPGGIIANSIMLTKALASIELISSGWKNIQEALQGLINLKVMEEAPELKNLGKKSIVKEADGQLAAENLLFYADAGQRAILKGVNFVLDQGDVLAVVGPSGSGKSSLIRLLLGTWVPNAGTARMDGADVQLLDSEYYFENVGYLPPQVLLYPGTVSENIARLAVPDKEKILRATEAAGCHDLILHLPNGYDTEVGANGGNLSLGQQQRIALARALYGNPRYLFLDEPNSNLDNEGEAALKQAIAHASQNGTTVLLVAHRSSMLGLCNKILVIRNGQQVVFGPRDEVLAKISNEPKAAA